MTKTSISTPASHTCTSSTAPTQPHSPSHTQLIQTYETLFPQGNDPVKYLGSHFHAPFDFQASLKTDLDKLKWLPSNSTLLRHPHTPLYIHHQYIQNMIISKYFKNGAISALAKPREAIWKSIVD